MKKELWPNLFIVGTPRAGTTTLYYYLNQIPQIFVSPEKEPNFFNPETVNNSGTELIQPIRNKEEYLKLFKNTNEEKYRCEATTHYLLDPSSPKMIHDVSPDSKIIISLRDPVERQYSHFKLIWNQAKIRKLNFSMTFQEEIEKQKARINSLDPGLKLECGLYYQNVKNYLEIFGKDNVKILIFEKWIKNFKNVMSEILEFLKIKHDLDDLHEDILHSSKSFREHRGEKSRYLLLKGYNSKIMKKIIPKTAQYFVKEKFLTINQSYPILDDKSRKMLIEFYDDDVRNLEKLLGFKLPWNNFKN